MKYKVEYNEHGHFCIVLSDETGEVARSQWFTSRAIGQVEHAGTTYFAVGTYYEGSLPVDQVFTTSVLPTTVDDSKCTGIEPADYRAC